MNIPALRKLPKLTPRRLALAVSVLATLGVTLLLSWWLVSGRTPELLLRLDQWSYDWTVRTTTRKARTPQVTVMELDEESLKRLGQWPWARNRIAELVTKVFDQYGARLLAFDMVFAEPDRSDAAAIWNRLEKVPAGQAETPLRREMESLARSLDRDSVLARALHGRPIVLGYYFTSDPEHRVGALPEPWLPADFAHQVGVFPQTGQGYGANLDVLTAAAPRAGHFNPTVDADGVTRRVPMLIESDGLLYPSLTLSALTLLAGDQAPVDFGQATTIDGRAVVEALTVGDFRLPIDASARTLLPFFGKRGTMPRVSAVDVLQGTANPALLRDRVIVFGPTAPGLKDSRATPVDRNQPGVELHASMLQGALDGRLPSQPAYMQAAVLSLLWTVAALMVWTARRLRPVPFTSVSVGIAASIMALGWGLWDVQGVVLPVALPLAQVGTLFVGLSLFGYLAETRSKNAINRLFGQYVPPELVNEMNDDPGNYSMSARSTELTVMFADVRGFTTLSERMEPAALADLMNQLLTELSRVIRGEHMGTIDKYIGDCVMAFWGAPVPRADHAAAAVAASLGMQKALAALVPRLVLPEGAHIAVGIGLNTGRAVVGNMGSAYRMAYTVLGDTVNTASRLEGLTKAYGAQVVAGDSVREAAAAEFLWCELDRVRVKGRDTPLAIHEPLCAAGEADEALRERVHRHEAALVDYRERRFAQAAAAWERLHAQSPSALHALWLDRARSYDLDPPGPDWDGVYTFETK